MTNQNEQIPESVQVEGTPDQRPQSAIHKEPTPPPGEPSNMSSYFVFISLNTHCYSFLTPIPLRWQWIPKSFSIDAGEPITSHPESSIFRTHQSWQWTTAELWNSRDWRRGVPQQCPTMPRLSQYSIQITTPQVNQKRLWNNDSTHWGALPRWVVFPSMIFQSSLWLPIHDV